MLLKKRSYSLMWFEGESQCLEIVGICEIADLQS